MDLYFSARSSGEDSDTFMDEEMMRLVMACLSPPRMLISWSPPPPPSPPAPVGFGGLWDFDDDRASPLQTGLIPGPASHADAAEVDLVTVRGTTYGDNTDSQKKLEHVSSKWHFHASLHEDSTDGSCLLKDKLTRALRYFKESTYSALHLLVQVWAPVKNVDRYVLTTSGQPFVIDHRCIGLLQYRAVSMMYMFSTDGSNAGEFGLPGRVFRLKVPEWTPNVLYYSNNEYPPLNHAISYNVHATVALPVFDPRTKSCVAVVELIMTSKKINFESEVDLMCKGLEAVNLISTSMPSHPRAQILNHGRQPALDDIAEILTIICETHRLPMAQTWVPCSNNGNGISHGGSVKNTCLNFDGRCIHGVCISTCDVAFYVRDAHMWGFLDACVEHPLQKGQGVSGEAFLSHRPCFSRDVSQASKLEYPLAHYARMFGLAACIAVCLQSSYTGDDVYILEFFLPPNCREDGDQKALLESIYALMKQNMGSLKAPSQGDFSSSQFSDMPVIGNGELKETDARNPESRHCESPLVLDRSKRMRGNTENAAASISVVQHHPSTQSINVPRSKSKSRSKVWNHFKRTDGARAICNYCNKDYAADPKTHGTSRLLRHLKDDHGIDPKASSSASGK